jgi:DNA repair ATPase RecN
VITGEIGFGKSILIKSMELLAEEEEEEEWE